MKKVLTIAGSDPSGGAGIQADLKTFAAHGVYGMSVITALTAQNTTGVFGVQDTTPEFIKQQMKCVFDDIPPDSVKIGMLSGVDTINAVADMLLEYGAKNIVADTVMISTSGSRLLSEDATDTFINRIFPIADIITPNIMEAEVLSGIKIENRSDMLTAAKKLSKTFGGSILIKGGHLPDSADDLLYSKSGAEWLQADKIDNPNTHGTGCTLSSAIACSLADGLSISQSVKNAKEYVRGAIADGLNIGKGRGPLNHMYRFNKFSNS